MRAKLRRGKISTLALSSALILFSAGGALAQRIGVTVNGEPVQFTGIGPQQIQGRVLVPVRGVLEKLGANVTWMPQTRTVVAATGSLDVQLKIGDRRATVNGREALLDVPAQVIAGSTMVPLRFLGETLGADVAWNGPTRTVQIVTHGGQSPNPTPPPQANARPVINSFTQDGRGWLRAGETLHVTLRGTAGGQASFRIPGLTTAQIPLRETAPGEYTGVWQVPANRPVQLTDAAVIGSLQVGGESAPLLQAARTISVDTAPPHVRDRAPDPNSRVTTARPNIYAVFADQGSGVDPGSVRLLVDGRDVTANANVTRDFISYRPASDLSAGRQTIQILQQDKAGNPQRTTWQFTVQPGAAGGIKSLQHNANHALEPGDVLHVEMTGTPGSKAFFSVGSIKDVRMQETSPGHYVADYTIRKGDDTRNGKLAARLVTPGGETYTSQSTENVVISAGKPAAPVITQPGPGYAGSSPLVICGKAAPNTQVHVKIDYQNRLLGVLAVQGTAADLTVDVDKNGQWQTPPITLGGLLGGRGMEYTISATTVNAADQTSDTTQVKFRLRA